MSCDRHVAGDVELYFYDELSSSKREELERHLSGCEDCRAALDELHTIRAALASVANTAVVPLQDLLGLGTEARMNLPNTTEGNWAWRFKGGALTEGISERLRELTELYGRANRSTVATDSFGAV